MIEEHGRVLAIDKADQRRWTADHLREIARKIEAGEASNVAVAFVLENDGVGRFHSMIDDKQRPWLLVAAVSALHHRLCGQVAE
jgi:hypothetical protein